MAMQLRFAWTPLQATRRRWKAPITSRTQRGNWVDPHAVTARVGRANMARLDAWGKDVAPSRADGLRSRVLTLIDDFSRRSRGLLVERSIGGGRVVRFPGRPRARRRLPKDHRDRQR